MCDHFKITLEQSEIENDSMDVTEYIAAKNDLFDDDVEEEICHHVIGPNEIISNDFSMEFGDDIEEV